MEMANAGEAPARASLVWSGRKDLNLRPLRPERSALPGCATPRPGVPLTKRGAIVLHQRVETQAVGIRHSPARDFSLEEIYAFGQPCIRADSGVHTGRSQF